MVSYTRFVTVLRPNLSEKILSKLHLLVLYFESFSHANSKVVRSFLGPNVSGNCTDQVALSVVLVFKLFLLHQLFNWRTCQLQHTDWV